MSDLKKDQNRTANNEQVLQNTTNDQMNEKEETPAQNDGFRYDYDDSSDL
ncbi:hypothetical protein [Alkalihalobacterium sp. APHAB7]